MFVPVQESLLANSIPFTVLTTEITLSDGCIINDAVLKNFLYKKFSRVCCLLFNYQGSFCRLLSLSSQLRYNTMCIFICQQFFKLFSNVIFDTIFHRQIDAFTLLVCQSPHAKTTGFAQ